MAKKKNIATNIGVIDLFCGIGGLSHGLKNKGFNIIAGYDLDKTCEYAFKENNDSVFYYKDITKVESNEIKTLFKDSNITVLAGCAPCQPFSSYSFKLKEKKAEKYDLLYEFGRLAEEVEPDIITMENVSQILSFKLKSVLPDFINTLQNKGYFVSVKVVYCPDYGIPQTRKRLVLLASKLGQIELIPPTHTPDKYVTVKDVIGELPAIGAGETCSTDSLHVSRSLSPKNTRRIKATSHNGGSWKDWSDDLILDCHKKKSGHSFGSVYGRMRWDQPSPTMTTLCTGLGNGRFGHPEQDRAISLREAALFQTFPIDYKYFAPEEPFSITKASRYIGNAVPPRLGEVIAESILAHISNLK